MTEQIDEDAEINIMAWKRLVQTGEIKLSSDSGKIAVQNIEVLENARNYQT